jgi:NADPH-dependent curcumin reductase CurA
MTEAEDRVLQSRMEALIWSRDSVNIGLSMTGGKQSEQDEPNLFEFQIGDKVLEAFPHRQEQTAQVHTVRKRDESNSEEDQDHKFTIIAMERNIGSR